MNESTLIQLKILVERAVRPVRASTSRRRKMREELLAHVVGVFEEEARLGDEPAALARTQERFGQATELTGQLQASVPRSEDLFGGSGPSALRLAASVAAVSTVLLGFVPFGLMILIDGQRGWLRVTQVPGLLFPLCMAFLAFFATLLIQGMRQALFGPARRSWLRAGLLADAAWILIPVTTFALSLAVTVDIQRSLWEFVVPLLPLNVLAPVALVVLVYVFDSECRLDREWARLDID